MTQQDRQILSYVGDDGEFRYDIEDYLDDGVTNFPEDEIFDDEQPFKLSWKFILFVCLVGIGGLLDARIQKIVFIVFFILLIVFMKHVEADSYRK